MSSLPPTDSEPLKRYPQLGQWLRQRENPARDTDILTLAFSSEASHEEIAARLGTARFTVDRVLQEAHHFLGKPMHVDQEPHIILAGDLPLSLEHKQRMATHLLTCEHCQETLESAIRAIASRAGTESPLRARGDQLLARLQATRQKTRTCTQMRDYAALAYRQGEAMARRRFPDLASHLAECRTCRSAMDTRVCELRASEPPASAPALDLGDTGDRADVYHDGRGARAYDLL